MLSQKAKYALKALSYLSKVQRSEKVQILDIAEHENIPKKFLEIILVELKKKGYVQSKTGKDGGYWLIKNPNEITVSEIIRLIDGPLAHVRCASLTAYLPCSDCDDVENCSIRIIMKEVRDSMSNILDSKKISDM